MPEYSGNLVIALMGASGSGKDTAFGILREILGNHYVTLAENFKFTRGNSMKDALEMIYGLPHGALDNPLVKAEVIPGHPEGRTYHEVMVR
ncbi:MAG: hypothetical protein EBS38_08535, partial [Actinobacteria bacterium]|nr:hypothetical protein [Actinomycetota bacterium]